MCVYIYIYTHTHTHKYLKHNQNFSNMHTKTDTNFSIPKQQTYGIFLGSVSFYDQPFWRKKKNIISIKNVVILTYQAGWLNCISGQKEYFKSRKPDQRLKFK